MKKHIQFIAALSFAYVLQIISADALVMYYDDGNSGETSQARGIAKAYEARTGEQAELITFSEEKTSQALTNRLTKNPDVLLFLGKDVFPIINEKSQELRHSKWKLAHLNHQICDGHEGVMDKLDMCFLPGHLKLSVAPTSPLANPDKVRWTNGVPFSLEIDSIASAYKELDLPENGRYVVVYLGGDAPDENGSWHRYTPGEAVKLVAHVQRTEPESTIIVINGPRTGKYNDQMEEVTGVHRGDAPRDAVTQAVADQLSGHSHKIFDFRFGKKSMYQPALSLVAAGKAKLYAPGESNSVITDVVALGLQPQTLVFTHSAMNPSHKANVEYARLNQGITYIDDKQEYRPVEPESTGSIFKTPENPNVQVVEGLMQLM